MVLERDKFSSQHLHLPCISVPWESDTYSGFLRHLHSDIYMDIHGYAYVAQAGPKHRITEGDLELPIFLPPLAECWDYRHALPHNDLCNVGNWTQGLHMPDTLQTRLHPSRLLPYF